MSLAELDKSRPYLDASTTAAADADASAGVSEKTKASLSSPYQTTRSGRDAEAYPSAQGDGDGEGADGEVVDAVWGRLDKDAPNYRGLSWWGSAIIQTKIQVGLGILGLPVVMRSLGLVIGIIVIIVVALLVTWTAYVLGVFKRRYPHVYTIADIGRETCGTFGYALMTFMFWLQMVLCLGSGLVGLSIALNAVSLHATCTVVFVVAAGVASAAFASIRTLDKISWLGWAGVVSIVASVLTLVVSVGVQDRPAAAPQQGEWVKVVRAVAQPSFVEAMNAISTVVLSYGGVSAYVSVAGEMKNPDEYTKSMVASHVFMTTLYLVLTAIIYHYVGQYISSPALGSAGILMKRVCYGLAIPGLLASCIIFAHLAAKTIFVPLFRKSRHLTASTWQHWSAWLGLVVLNTLLAFVLAMSIPFFGDLLSLVGALLSTFLIISFIGFVYIWLVWRDDRRSWRWQAGVGINALIIVLGFFLQIAGTYTAILSIIDNVNAGTNRPFSCADNSHST